MAVMNNESTRVFGNYKNINLTPPVARESNPTATDLPTTKPATAQVSFTLQQSDLPVFSINPLSAKFVPYVNVSGQNNTGGAVTINYEIHKNGASVASGSKTNIANVNYWSIDCGFGYCVPGDLLEVFMWSSVSPSCNYSYYSIYTYVSNVQISKDQTLCKNFSLATVRGSRSYSLLTSTNYASGSLSNYYYNNMNSYTAWSGGTTVIPYFSNESTKGFLGCMSISNTDGNPGISAFTSTTKLVNYVGNSYFTNINYREMLR